MKPKKLIKKCLFTDAPQLNQVSTCKLFFFSVKNWLYLHNVFISLKKINLQICFSTLKTFELIYRRERGFRIPEVPLSRHGCQEGNRSTDVKNQQGPWNAPIAALQVDRGIVQNPRHRFLRVGGPTGLLFAIHPKNPLGGAVKPHLHRGDERQSKDVLLPEIRQILWGWKVELIYFVFYL